LALDRALFAVRKGLAGKARDLLLESDLALFGDQGMALELELLLKTGRAKEVREWTLPEQRKALGPTFHWLRAQAFAASGNYRTAARELSALAPSGLEQQQGGARTAMARLIGQALLNEQLGPQALPQRLWRAVLGMEFRDGVISLARSLQHDADATVIRGLLALEQGDVDEARRTFRLALSLWRDEAAAASGAGLDFGGRIVAQQCLAWIEGPTK